MKRKFSKKKIALSVTSVTLVVAMLIAFVPTALASEDRSLEYIELLKQKESFKILEIAPSESDGNIGYYVKDSEPIANWKEKAAMYTSPAARESYVNNEVNAKLLEQGVMSKKVDEAPLYLEDMYDEFYPWEVDDKENYNVLNLDNDESVKVKGKIEETDPGKGDYVSNDIYVPVENNFKNYFDYSEWRTTLGATLREKLGENYNVDKFSNTKILSVNKNDKSLTVFGSTETNWSQTYANESTSVLYDLVSVYDSSEYYGIEMEENKDKPNLYHGGSFILSLDAKVYNGKGQVSIVPYDAYGNIIKYSPNISKQYWYRQESVSTGHYEFKFSVPEDSYVKYVQIRFDVNNIKASATFHNISVYKYNTNIFDVGAWKTNSTAITNSNGVIAVKSSVNETTNPLFSTSKVTKNKSYIECESNTFYSLTYHAELMPGGGKTKVYVVGYDKNGDYIGKDFIQQSNWSKKESGTYSVDFNSGNAKYLVVVFNITGSQKAYYSNISLTKPLDYAKEDVAATHRQVIDYFSNGDVGSEYGENIFNFHNWYDSASYSSAPSSSINSSVVADESNGIITITNRGSSATSETFKTTDNMYYISVDDSAEYRISYTVNSSSTASHTIKVVYCDEKKNEISEDNFYITPEVAGPDEYSVDFTTLANCRWIQIGFGNTEDNQKNIFSSISIRKNEAPKVYYYNLLFTKIASINDIEAMSGDTAIYTPKYKKVGTAGSFTDIEEGEKYYIFDEYNDEYVEITDFAKIEAGKNIYQFSGIYDYVGHAGDNDISFNIKKEYYTAEINYDGYNAVKNPSTLGAGTVYYVKNLSGDYTVEGIVNDSTVFNSATQYYINTPVIREVYDESHPYWVVADEFEAVNDYTALFTRKSEGYRYVGAEKGDYIFVSDPDGKEEMVISTSIVYYKGGMINNEWFKRGVLNCNEEQMKNIAVTVTTVSPTYLNSLDEEALIYFLQGYELVVISYGGVDGKTSYQEDISAAVRNVLYKEVTDTWETIGGTGEEVTTNQYKIPVMIDNRVCKMDNEKDKKKEKFVNLPGLANELCTDISEEGGVNKYIYKFNPTDVRYDVNSIVNNLFLENLRTTYTSTTSPYYAIYKEIIYENFIRSANKDKYTQLDPTVSEATAIRYILNFRGQRIQKYKEKIRILEIQPYTEESELLEADGTIKTEVKQWFSPTGDLTYVDENNEVQVIDLEITTMALGELAAKNGSIVENNDVIYIGSSLKNLDIVGNHNTGGTKLDSEGHIVPDYEDNNLDGCYYTSTGDTVYTGADKNGYRAPLAGLVGTDYKAFRDAKIDLGLFSIDIGKQFEGTALDLWYVDGSDCTLRKSGNDMTVNIKEQLEAFANSGRPIIYSDDLVENEFVGAFKVNISYEISGWDKKADLPIIKFTADLDTNGSTLPEGVQPSFAWFCQSTSGLNLTVASFSGATLSESDIDGDGVNEGVYEFTFNGNEDENQHLRGYGDYFAYVTFKFAKAKYKGLRQISGLRSERVTLSSEDINYKLYFNTSMKHNLQTVEAVFELDGPGYMPNLYTNGGQNYIFNFVWKSRSFGGSYGQAHNETVTFSPDPFTPGSGYNPLTDKKITTTVTFDEKRYDYQLSLYVDAADENDPTLQIYYATFKQEEDKGSIRYYKFSPHGDGTSVTSASGIALNDAAFDNSSYTYECMTNIFKNYQNVFSETMLNLNENLERNNLIKYSNLSAPEIIITEDPICYPDMLENGALSFKFKILNYTDDTIATTRYRYEFYVDNNSDGKFSANELTDANVYGSGNVNMESNLRASTEEKINEYSFYKKFPATTSGIVPWKFIITKVGDETTEATTHNSITKYSYIKPSTPTLVSAVQILPANWSSSYTRSYSDSEAVSHKYSDIYKGSVFLSDVFVSNALTVEDDTHLSLTRVINYGVYSGSTYEKAVSGTPNAKYDADIAAVQISNSGKNVVPASVDFTVGTDWSLNVSFKNVSQINDRSSGDNGTDDVYNDLNIFDMIILGFGDAYGRHEQDGNTTVTSILTNEGFQQGSVKALERLIDEGKATLFCHDTAFYSNNFVSYIANDIANWFSESLDKITDFFKRLFGAGGEDLTPNLHSSRVKQGYYLNIGLRDKLGLDRYGVTKNIKDRIVARDNYNTYNDIEYNNENLRDGHDYATIYFDGRKSDVKASHKVTDTFNSEMIWNKGKTISVQTRIDEYLDGGYDIAYLPNSNRQKVDVFFQGYSDFVIEKFRSGDGIDEDHAKLAMTNEITQVNSGQITNYPYDINTSRTVVNDRKEYGTLSISPTHDQVYQVSLQVDENGDGTTVWYALNNPDQDFSSSRMTNYKSFRNNATNGYFIYTHKNVTYTGSGHTNTFSEAEAKLFINTIVAAYRIVADKPVFNYLTEDGQTVISYKTVTTTNESGKFEIEDDKIYFKIKDTSVDSEVVKTLGVDFYLTATPSEDEAGNVTYTYSDKVGYVDNVKGNRVTSVKVIETDELTSGVIDKKMLKLVPGDSSEEDLNEVVLYAVPRSTATGFAGKSTTVYGDHAELTIRELNLRTLV